MTCGRDSPPLLVGHTGVDLPTKLWVGCPWPLWSANRSTTVAPPMCCGAKSLWHTMVVSSKWLPISTMTPLPAPLTLPISMEWNWRWPATPIQLRKNFSTCSKWEQKAAGSARVWVPTTSCFSSPVASDPTTISLVSKPLPVCGPFRRIVPPLPSRPIGNGARFACRGSTSGVTVQGRLNIPLTRRAWCEPVLWPLDAKWMWSWESPACDSTTKSSTNLEIECL